MHHHAARAHAEVAKMEDALSMVTVRSFTHSVLQRGRGLPHADL